jgi:hypothetical protein
MVGDAFAAVAEGPARRQLFSDQSDELRTVDELVVIDGSSDSMSVRSKTVTSAVIELEINR